MPSAKSALVVFGEDWGRHPSSTQHLVSRLAAKRNVIWVNSIGLRRPSLNGSDLQRAGDKVLRMAGIRAAANAGAAAETPTRLSVLAPRALSWPGSRIADAFNRRSLGQQIRNELRRRALSRPLLWTSLPTALPVLGAIGERAVIYYCGDDFSGLSGVDHGPVSAMEQRLASKADLIVACSQPLCAKFDVGKTVLLPHGVDLRLFQTPAARPPDLPDAPRIAGYYGGLSPWLDIDALVRAARNLPDWLFVFVGPVRCDVDRLRAEPNVRLLGEKPHAMLPAYVQHWTVSLLPFLDTVQIRASNPLKLREYLAVGAPIVSPPFDAMQDYAHLIEPVEYGGDYGRAIVRAAADNDRNAMRRTSVADESWDARAATLDALLMRFDTR